MITTQVTTTLPPGGNGERPLRVRQEVGRTIEVFSRDGNDPMDGIETAFDWFEDRLQVLVMDAKSDEPAVYVRFNDDGTIAEILIGKHVPHDIVKRQVGS